MEKGDYFEYSFDPEDQDLRGKDSHGYEQSYINNIDSNIFPVNENKLKLISPILTRHTLNENINALPKTPNLLVLPLKRSVKGKPFYTDSSFTVTNSSGTTYQILIPQNPSRRVSIFEEFAEQEKRLHSQVQEFLADSEYVEYIEKLFNFQKSSKLNGVHLVAVRREHSQHTGYISKYGHDVYLDTGVGIVIEDKDSKAVAVIGFDQGRGDNCINIRQIQGVKGTTTRKLLYVLDTWPEMMVGLVELFAKSSYVSANNISILPAEENVWFKTKGPTPEIIKRYNGTALTMGYHYDPVRELFIKNL